MVLAWLATLFLVTACGGGGSTTPSATLSKIAITPASTSMAEGLSTQYAATGTYSDSSTANITSKVTWASSVTTVATINSSGLASTYGLVQGTTNITASLNGITSNVAALTVGPPVLASITISPSSANINLTTGATTCPSGLGTCQFGATGTMTDGTSASLGTLTWTSGTPAVATIDVNGLATALSIVGTTNITASNGGITSNIAVLAVGYGSFATTANPMTTPRSGHTATLLSDGTNRVLIAGGTGISGSLKTAELYDPAADTFTATANPMTAARNNHTATLLPSGKVLLIGGLNGSAYLNTATLYDPGTGLFTATGNMSTARGYHTATLLTSGMVLVIGGFNGTSFLSSAELFDPAGNGGNGSFTATGGMSSPRAHHTATLLPSGKVLVTGGTDGSFIFKTAELYDPAAGTFTATGAMTTARQYHTATLLSNNKVLITGGDTGGAAFSSAELYDPAAGTGTFTPTGSMTTARTYHTATLLSNGDVLVAGGSDGLGGYLASAGLYGLASSTFGYTGPMLAARAYYTATLLSTGNKVLVTGGYNGTTTLLSAELFQ